MWASFHGDHGVACPYGQPGDRLWVRETFTPIPIREPSGGQGDKMGFAYRADGDSAFDAMPDEWDFMGKWTPSIFMPRAACRLVLEVTAVRVERLQEISHEDAEGEGLTALSKDGGRTLKYGIPDRDGLPGTDDDGWPWERWDIDARIAYKRLWDSINAKRAPWASNPWVWVISFNQVK